MNNKLKILVVPDVMHWAIGKLSRAIQKNNPDMDINIYCVHPRDARDVGIRDKFIKEVESFKPDVIHFQYWNTAQQLIKAYPEIKKYKLILTHHNQKNLLSENWQELGIDQHVCHTQKAKDILSGAGYHNNTVIIQHGINLNYFEFNQKLPTEFEMFGYVGRVCPWKGLKEIAQASRELGYQLCFMGKMDKMDYWESISADDRSKIYYEFKDCKDSERIEAYYSMNVYVGNSGDGREEGPLGLLEAMACGVPIVSTPSGEGADILVHEENALVVEFGNYDQLKQAMKRLMQDKELAERLRQNAWNTVKNMTEEKMALEYRKLYKNIIYDNQLPLVSVIIPYTEDREENVAKIVEAYQKQTYEGGVEILALDDNVDGYNLAHTRNYGAELADGEILIFNDSRMLPDQDAVEKVVNKFLKDFDKKVWYFGNKDDAKKKSFVENFSAIRRDYFIKGGMCAEWIRQYGAMSQELRTRFAFAGFEFEYVDDFKCKTLSGTHKTRERRKDIVKSKFLLYRLGL